MARVVFRGATKRYGDVTALDCLDLEVGDGELLVLLGPSGCGKTTALRMVAGLEDADDGEILIGDQVVNHVEARARDVAMVFQSYALYPHLTVAGNIEFPLRQRGLGRDDRRRLVAQAAASLGLGDLLGRKPRQLSGGQRQRVALARAIVRQPVAFLMDEPLSNLDAALRQDTRADIVALQKRLGTTTLYVTHDQVEAMTMGERIAVLDHGVLQQLGTPEDLYDRPASAFVARFLGSPGMNLVPGTVEAGRPRVVRVAGGAVALEPGVGSTLPRSVTVGVRPEHLAIDLAGTVDATVALVELLGAEVHLLCRLPDGSTVVVRQAAGAPRPANGDPVRLSVARLHLFAADTGARVEPAGVTSAI